ncbi:AzlD domain-containing protein [Lacticaseibacillus suibinensis]|uniref:AzlD domain-containing protein n=1 Tax=Lacticaseibacillus suibinensis TaxID=2486011 RepID=UPI000F7BA0B0|nr:AzlD domain-containing protein [Lacticaseibacillus suibinensis]
MTKYILLTIVLSGLVTWLLRVVPFVLVKTTTLPAAVVRFLSFVPVAILTAIFVESLLVYRPGAWPGINWENLLASLPAVVTAVITKSLLAVVLVGVIAMAVIRLLGWG